MNSRVITALAAVAMSLTAIAGCSSAQPTAPSASSSSAPSQPPSSAAADLSVADTSLGKIIVDANHLTAYIFTKDTANSGKSSCAGPCLVAWPPIISASKAPQVDGVTGKVGTITLADGKYQITVNGLPIYTFEKDKAAGDVTGQAVGKVWYVLAPDGTQIKKTVPGS